MNSIRKCIVCGKSLKGRQSKYCCSKCKQEERKNQKIHPYTCLYCGKSGMSIEKDQKFCNRSHATKYQHQINPQTGEKNPNWKGGKSLHSKGYIYVYKPHHPNANASGYIFEDRLVMEEKLGRHLEADEDVHHKNGNKKDNSLENLEVMNHGQHTAYHQRERAST